MKRIVLLLSVLALALVSAAPAFAQDPNLDQGGVNLQRDAGDNVVDGQVVGDDTPDCDQAADVLESGLCAPGAGLNEDQGTLEDVPNPTVDAEASASASAPAVQYQYNADEQYNAGDQYQAPGGFLPETGGFNLPLFIGVVLLIGGIIVASRLYLRRRHQ